MDRVLHNIAKVLLEDMGAAAVRIHDNGVEAKLFGNTIRVTVERL